MNATARLPLPSLSSGRFSYALDAEGPHPAQSGQISALSDQALFDGCGVRIAFSERSGGVSEAPYSSLNLKHDLGDAQELVVRNQRILLDALDAPAAFIQPHQVHGTQIVSLSSSDEAEVAQARHLAAQGADALVLSCSKVAGLLCFADCLPLVLVAPGGAFAIVHCGWRGVLAHLAALSFQELLRLSSCAPEQVNAYIGPYIHAECFETDAQLAQNFAEEFGPGVSVCGGEGSTQQGHVNLAEAVKADLLSCGLDSRRLADCELCTSCHTDRFYSYRAEGGRCGRHGALAFRA